MKRSALILCVIMAIGLLSACSKDQPEATQTSADTIETTTVTSETTALPTLTPSPTPTPIPSPIYVEEMYSIRANGDRILSSVEKTQDDHIVYSALYFLSGHGISDEVFYEYDDNGLLIGTVSTNTVKKDDYITSRNYCDIDHDSNGNITKKTYESYEVDPDTSEETYSATYVIDYEYDDEDRLISERYYDQTTGKTSYENSYEYDENGRLSAMISISQYGTEKTVYTYSGDLLINEKRYLSDQLCYETDHQYDENGNEILRTETSYDHTHWETDTCQSYFEYDEEGRVIKSGNYDYPENYSEYVYYTE
ncbi:MAG: hypothetical protein J6U54_04495 [Clostridiales bacterium]|nr:hypothetical protein [Clostridiales bacterium]